MTDWPDGYGRRVLDEVDSTLNEAARIAPDLAAPEWILARRQTAARGRRGRGWVSPTGNFAATLVLRLDGPAQQAALRSFVAALALFDACVAVTGRPDGFSLKWPNDVLLNGGKLAGILLESAGGGGGAMPLFIGVGVNLSEAPPADLVEARALRPVSLAGETGVRVGPEDFLTELAAAYARQGNKGMASLVTAERYAMTGRLEDAGLHAQRASDLLPRGSTGWRRAQDVLSAAKAAEKKRR